MATPQERAGALTGGRVRTRASPGRSRSRASRVCSGSSGSTSPSGAGGPAPPAPTLSGQALGSSTPGPRHRTCAHARSSPRSDFSGGGAVGITSRPPAPHLERQERHRVGLEVLPAQPVRAQHLLHGSLQTVGEVRRSLADRPLHLLLPPASVRAPVAERQQVGLTLEGAPSRSKVSPSVLRRGPAAPTPTMRLKNALEDRLSLDPSPSSGLDAAAVADVPAEALSPSGLLRTLGGLSGNMTTPRCSGADGRTSGHYPPSECPGPSGGLQLTARGGPVGGGGGRGERDAPPSPRAWDSGTGT